eukprot:Skav232156  [mRNA]  locus=scaffold1040:454615:460384:+ [translate_table: standard]
MSGRRLEVTQSQTSKLFVAAGVQHVALNVSVGRSFRCVLPLPPGIVVVVILELFPGVGLTILGPASRRAGSALQTDGLRDLQLGEEAREVEGSGHEFRCCQRLRSHLEAGIRSEACTATFSQSVAGGPHRPGAEMVGVHPTGTPLLVVGVAFNLYCPVTIFLLFRPLGFNALQHLHILPHFDGLDPECRLAQVCTGTETSGPI